MDTKFSRALSALGFISAASSLHCDHYADTGLPCVEVSRCSDSVMAQVQITKLSNGLGDSKSYSDISMCFDDINLYVTHNAYKQIHFTNPGYKECNDPIFNSDVAELFIAPNMESVPHCYNELDISPYNVMFNAGIYNQNLNRTGIEGYEFDCVDNGITYSTFMDMTSSYWRASMSFSFELLNCPYNCPLARYVGVLFTFSL